MKISGLIASENTIRLVSYQGMFGKVDFTLLGLAAKMDCFAFVYAEIRESMCTKVNLYTYYMPH